MVRPSGCRSSTMPRPLRNDTTGAPMLLGQRQDFGARHAARRRRPRSSAPSPHPPALPARRSSRGPGVGLRMQRQRILRRHLGDRGELVPRHFERDRTAPAGQHFLERARDEIRRLRSGARCGRRISAGVRSVASWSGSSCSWPRSAADHRAGHLAGEAQHRRIHAPGGGERRAWCSSRPGPGTTA